MDSHPLRDLLLAVDGVAEATVDGNDDAPGGVRIVLAADADADRVGREVREILATYGIRARVAGAEPVGQARADQPPPPPGAPGEVVELHGLGGRNRGGVAAAAAAPAMADPVSVEMSTESARRRTPVVTGAILDSLTVEETRDGVLVTAAAADGRTASRRARWTEGGVNEAVVAAVADLAGWEGPPLLLSAAETDVAGSTVVTLLVERVDGKRVAGAAIVETGTAYAVARAAWQALSEA